MEGDDANSEQMFRKVCAVLHLRCYTIAVGVEAICGNAVHVAGIMAVGAKATMILVLLMLVMAMRATPCLVIRNECDSDGAMLTTIRMPGLVG